MVSNFDEYIKRRLCFVLMPFSKAFKNQWELAIKPAIIDANLTPWRGDEDKLGTNIIIRDVTRSITNSILIIADISGRNPNVMYELGLAHAAKKNVIMLIQKEEEVPFDVSHVRFLKYDPLELTELKDSLLSRIKSTLNMTDKEKPDLFPELKIMSYVEQSELNYLRSKTIPIEINVYPPTADIFFNNKLIGNGKVHIYVNAQASSNTVSCSLPDFYEVYLDIEMEHLNSGIINITLDPRDDKDIYKRVPQWLRYRRKDPNNPVLMRAIGVYLSEIGENKDALAESQELLDLTPGWYLAHNLIGTIIAESGDINAGEEYYKKVISLKPDHYIGYYNLACTEAIRGKYDKSIIYINKIVNNNRRLESYIYRPSDLFTTDKDFDSLKKDKHFSGTFFELMNKINNFRKQFFKS